MKKTKLEKGITLIALIITIVVLLILAVVTIGAIQESKIIAHAKNAAGDYKEGRDKENEILQDYINQLDKYSNKKEETDDLKRILEIRALLNELDYDKEDPEEVKNQIKAEREKLEAKYEEILGKEEDLIGFYMRNDDYHYGYVYNVLTKKFFKSTLDLSNYEMGLTYVLEGDEANEILAEMIELKEYLKREFVGKTYVELREMEKNNEIISKINNEFVASNDFNEVFANVYSDRLSLGYKKSSKDIQGEMFVFNFHFHLRINEQTTKVEIVQAGSDYLWGA